MEEFKEDERVVPMDVGYKGPYPDDFDPEAEGAWYVATVSNTPVGVVWSNNKKGFGFMPADSEVSPNAPRAVQAFKALAEVAGGASHTAEIAYLAAKNLEGYGVSEEKTGKLGGVTETYHSLSAITAAIVAAAGGAPLPNGQTQVAPGDTLAATIDSDGTVLELIYSNTDGIYVRDTGEWTLADTSVDQPTIDDQEWFDVTPDFVAVFDSMMQKQDDISRDEVVPYGAAHA